MGRPLRMVKGYMVVFEKDTVLFFPSVRTPVCIHNMQLKCPLLILG